MRTSLIAGLFVLLLGTSFCWSEDVRLMPKSGETLYFKRFYSKDHLAKNPKQFVDKIVIEIGHDGGDSTPWVTVRVSKIGDEVYMNSGLWEEEKGGTIRIFLEGDAGTATITPGEGHILLKLRGDDYLGFEGSNDFLELSASDADHRTFKLYPATKTEAALK